MSHSPNYQQTRTTDPDIEGGQTSGHIHDVRSMLMTLLASQSDQLPSPKRHGRAKLMPTQAYVTREDNDANHERIRRFLFPIFIYLFKPQSEDPRISVCFIFLSFSYQLLPGDNEQYLPTHGSPMLPVIPAPYLQS